MPIGESGGGACLRLAHPGGCRRGPDLGSDAPVETPQTPSGESARPVTRQRLDGSPGPRVGTGTTPDRRPGCTGIQRVQTCFAAGLEDRVGKIRQGLGSRPFWCSNQHLECPPADICHILPAATMSGGQWVHNTPEPLLLQSSYIPIPDCQIDGIQVLQESQGIRRLVLKRLASSDDADRPILFEQGSNLLHQALVIFPAVHNIIGDRHQLA